MFNKFTVWKNSDLVRSISGIPDTDVSNVFNEIARGVEKARSDRGADPSPKYIVINMDEPYADEIIEILKRNGVE